MFYTLVSRTIISKLNVSNEYFYIFLIGSIGYVILHWYLYSDKHSGFIEKMREYIYYAMILDASVAYGLMVMYPLKSKKPIDDSNNDDSNNEYSLEQKNAIMMKMQEARIIQQENVEKLKKVNNKDNIIDNIIDKIEEKIDDKIVEKTDSIKKSIFSKSDKSTDTASISTKSNVVNKKKKKDTEIEDTDIPLYDEKNKKE